LGYLAAAFIGHSMHFVHFLGLLATEAFGSKKAFQINKPVGSGFF